MIETSGLICVLVRMPHRMRARRLAAAALNQSDQFGPELRHVLDPVGNQSLGDVGPGDLTDDLLTRRRQGDHQATPVNPVATANHVTRPFESLDDPTHRLLLDSARRGELALSQWTVLQGGKRDQASMSEVEVGEDRVPVLLDQTCRRGQQPTQWPVRHRTPGGRSSIPGGVTLGVACGIGSGIGCHDAQSRPRISGYVVDALGMTVRPSVSKVDRRCG